MIYVITAVHNRYDITKKFICQLLEQSYKDIQLILVDDASTDGTAAMVKKVMPDAVILHGDGNLWWGGALHKAYQWIKDSADNKAYVMFANDDTMFDGDYIERAIGILKSKEHVLLSGCGIEKKSGKQLDGAVVYDFRKVSSRLSDHCEGNCASTRSLFFRVEDFKTIGGFHPVFLPHYASDYEWTIRACKKFGYKVCSDPDLKYYVSPETTGNNSYQTMTRKQALSKKSVSNPVYKFSFIFLVTPIKYLPSAMASQIGRYFGKRKMISRILRR